MRESEEYIIAASGTCCCNDPQLSLDDAEHAVKLAYKEGYLEAKADILEELRKDEGLLMISAIVAIRKMKLEL